MSTFCFGNDLDHFSFTASGMGDNLIKTFLVNPDTPTQPISCKQAVFVLTLIFLQIGSITAIFVYFFSGNRHVSFVFVI